MNEDEIVSFPEWREVLGGASALSAEVKRAYVGGILAALRACKSAGRPLSAGFIRWHLGRAGLSAEARVAERAGLAWLFTAARAAGKTRRSERAFTPPVAPEAGTGGPPNERQGVQPPHARAEAIAGRDAGRHVPPRAASDQGGADWERDLIGAIRRKGFLWRTEQTYRAWAARFAKFLAPRSPYAARGEEVAAFLSALAVEQRAAPSTQKQALNALVFLMQEGLRIDLGEMDFRRARARERMPTVLSKAEVKQVLERLPRGYRLMAEVMYGGGLRLMELLRLRVHHLDLARGQVKVYGGKGDRVNGFANAADRPHLIDNALRLCAAVRF